MEALRRIVTFAFVSTLLVFVFLMIAGQFAERTAAETHSIILRDEFTGSVHRITGIVPVAYSCAELSVRAEPVEGKTYLLRFETWNGPSVECAKEETPRWIQIPVFIKEEPPHFTATLDGKSLPISVYPYSSRHNATTTNGS